MEYQCTKVQAECNRTGCQQRDIEIKVLKSSIYIEVRNHATGLGVSLGKESKDPRLNLDDFLLLEV